MTTIRFTDDDMQLSPEEIGQLIDRWRKEASRKTTSREQIDQLIIEKAHAYGLSVSILPSA
jgi:hypothetical protein